MELFLYILVPKKEDLVYASKTLRLKMEDWRDNSSWKILKFIMDWNES